jgi:hypothetical protein
MKALSSLAAGVLALGVASSPALASVSRTFVSGVGSDTGTCALTAPCRTFAYALTQTAPSGEIIVLSSGGFGSVTIAQSVSIINVGYYAGVTVASGNGITINAGANDSILLRGIAVDGGGTGSNGIVLNSGGNLIVDQCNLLNFVGNVDSGTGNGIIMLPTSGGHNIVITNTSASHNQGAGVYYSPVSGTATVGIVIDHVNATNNGYGIALSNSGGATSASISNSIGSDNANFGYLFANVTVSLDLSYASGNQGGGVTVNSATTLALGRSVIMTNGIGIDISPGGTVNSYKDNRIAGNGTPVSGTLTPVNPQ